MTLHIFIEATAHVFIPVTIGNHDHDFAFEVLRSPRSLLNLVDFEGSDIGEKISDQQLSCFYFLYLVHFGYRPRTSWRRHRFS